MYTCSPHHAQMNLISKQVNSRNFIKKFQVLTKNIDDNKDYTIAFASAESALYEYENDVSASWVAKR